MSLVAGVSPFRFHVCSNRTPHKSKGKLMYVDVLQRRKQHSKAHRSFAVDDLLTWQWRIYG